MRIMWRNQEPIWYCLYKGREEILDGSGFSTGQYTVSYDEPVLLRANVSAAGGYSQVEQFGNLDSYDKVIATDKMDCPIDEHTVLFVDKEPEFDGDGNPLFDYVVRRVAKSLNSISIAISKVAVS